MNRIEMTWTDGDWADGVAEDLVETMTRALEAGKRTLPDEVKVSEPCRRCERLLGRPRDTGGDESYPARYATTRRIR